MKFATKLTVMVLGIVVTFAVIISYIVYRSNIETLEQEIKGRLEDTAFHTMDKIDRMLFERYADIKVIAVDPVISSKNSTPRQIRERLAVYRNYYKTYVSLSFFDLNRIAIADTAGLDIGVQVTIHGFWKNVVQGKTSAASSIELSKSLRTTVIYFASPVKDKNGEIFGVVVARVPLSKLYYVVREAGGIQEGREELKIDLVDKDGLLLYSNYNRGGILKNNLSDWEAVQRVKAGKQRGSKRHKHLGKEETIYAFAKEQGYLDFKGNDWTLLLHIPTKVAFAPAVQLRNRMIAILSVIIVLTIVISLIFSRTISGPIINLKNTAVEIGKGKLDTKIEIASNDEIGELAASFNDMTGKLKEYYAHLKESHTHLEGEVQGRTTELTSANIKLEEEIAQRSAAQRTLNERIKELSCLFSLSKLVEQPEISLEQIFQETTHLIRGAYQYPDVTCVRITFNGMQYKTDNFEKSELSQYAQINVRGDEAGAIEVYYLRESPESGQSPFLKEEGGLLDAVAKHLGRVAERSQVGEKLQLFRSLTERSNDGIFVVEPQWGRFLDVNEKACDYLGYTREELLNMTVKDIDDSIRDDSCCTERAKEIRKEGYMIFESVYKRKDGTAFPVEINVAFIEQEKKGYLLAIVRDITERRIIEAALKESEEKYRKQFEEAMDAIFIADAETGLIIDCNAAAAELVGREKTELVGKHQRILHPPEEIEGEFSVTFKQHLEKEEGQALEAKIITKDGQIRDVAIKANLLEVKGRKLIQGIFRDITERKRAEERQAELLGDIESINKELKDFAYIISHDLKAPLRGIRTLTDWISADYAGKLGEQGEEQMDLLSGRVDRMQNLIDGVLQYSRVGRVKEEKTNVNLNELVPEVIDTVAPPENIAVTVEDKLPVVECEETRIIQVFQNLLSNAVKYMDKPKGQIKVGCVEDDDFWKFSVADNGPGIEEKHFERIFQIFQTLSPRDEFESTGVGLTVVKKIVEMYGGRIWVESKPGEGSTFFFTLPKQEMGVKDAKHEANIVS